MNVKEFKFDITDSPKESRVLDLRTDCRLTFAAVTPDVVMVSLLQRNSVIAADSAEIPEGKTAAEVANTLIPKVLNTDAITRMKDVTYGIIDDLHRQIKYLNTLIEEIES